MKLYSKHKLVWSSLSVVLVYLILFIGFSAYITDENPEVKSWMIQHSNEVELQLKKYLEKAKQFQEGKCTLQELQKEHLETRLKYKTIEFLLEHYYPEHTKEYINGAPLFHKDPYPYQDNPNDNYYPGGAEAYMNSLPLDYIDGGHYQAPPRITAPKGLQVLDELLFADEAENQQEILEQVELLNLKFSALQKGIKIRKYYLDFELIEAARLELIRIFSMGVTGFDTPGSLAGIAEAQSSFEGVDEALQLILNTENPHTQNIHTLFTKGAKYLKKHNDFEQFNRMEFLKEYINPLYKELMLYSTSEKLETTQDLVISETAWNFYSENLFDEDFLNPYYYSMVKRSDDSEALRNLGKRLFYDPILSHGEKLSCSSCHVPALAFTDGLPKSASSVQGQFLDRNSPSLVNAVFADRYFYDLRAFDLPDQASHVIESHLEFNTDFNEITDKLNNNVEYTQAFNNIYNDNKPITRSRFSNALASYVMSLISYDSPFDQYVRGETTAIDADVIKGFNLFMGKANCGTCHYAPHFSGLVPPLFKDSESEVIGVLAAPETMRLDKDLGRYENGVPNEKEDIYMRSFKTTSIRNAGITAPYFHNGAYKTLEEVLEFYNNGGALGIGMNYEVPNQTLSGDSLHLNNKEIMQLKAFIESLSDTTIISKFGAI
ncbi:MAG: cytochrome-c peroxidase [Crocinitomicaceae bacterium]|nr:cytochrome-c peroxidase [Crocinitomicaceae bacterium]|tara:strand:+ start:2593 stop:4575 length:1983 start_codon:yes stop_codon:yes gene_type:complete